MAGRYRNENFGSTLDMGYNDVSDGMPFPSEVLDENRTKILLTGLRRSGKSSIQRVVFEKMSPNETLFLEPTNEISRHNVNNGSFVQFQIWDFPGDLEFDDRSGVVDSERIFKGAGALIFVIDAQDDLTTDTLSKLNFTVTRAYEVNPHMKFEVFIHKVDGLSDENKLEAQRNIQEQASEELAQSKVDIRLNYYLTSIFDHSIFEAFSKVVQKLIPQLPTLERLLDIMQSNCRMEKTFLIDVVSKIYIATDSYPVDMQIYELCSDMIDVVIDVSCIYGLKQEGESDPETRAVIKLNNGMVLYLRELNKYLALVCMIRADKFDKQGLIDYNFECLKKAITGVFEVSKMHVDRNRF